MVLAVYGEKEQINTKNTEHLKRLTQWFPNEHEACFSKTTPRFVWLGNTELSTFPTENSKHKNVEYAKKLGLKQYAQSAENNTNFNVLG